MKPTKFKEQTTVFAENQPQYQPLPAHVSTSQNGEVVTCWSLSWRERITLLFTGKIWVQLLMFRRANGVLNPLTPSYLTIYKSEVLAPNQPKEINFDVLHAALRTAKTQHPPGTELVIIIHDDLYNSKGVDIAATEDRLDKTPVVPYSDAAKHIELTTAFGSDNFLIVESFYRKNN